MNQTNFAELRSKVDSWNISPEETIEEDLMSYEKMNQRSINKIDYRYVKKWQFQKNEKIFQ